MVESPACQYDVMKPFRTILGLAILLVVSVQITALAEPGWKVGVAVSVITPKQPMTLQGFSSRKKAAEGKATELHAKTLAIQDADGKRLVIVTCDLLGIPRPLRDQIEEIVAEKYQLAPADLLLNASHTHCGPELQMTPASQDGLTPQRKKLTIEYAGFLQKTLIDLIGRALEKIEPANLQYSHARCGFAMNRRWKNPDPKGEPYLNHPNPDGVVDHDVPVLQVTSPDGKDLRAVLFGYACHTTTMWENVYSGDYAGYAQKYLEEDHPGMVALFMAGCGGDQCGYPRGKMLNARRHGRSLATSVDAALGNTPRPIGGKLQNRYGTVALSYATPPTRKQLEAVAAGRPDAAFKPWELTRAHAKRLLRQLDREGSLLSSYDYPVQTIRFGDDLVMVALAGEVVADYSLRLKRELAGPAAVWIAGYSNDVFAYIPSVRLLKEGGYEPCRSMSWWLNTLQPGPFADSVEKRIVGKVHALLDGE